MTTPGYYRDIINKIVAESFDYSNQDLIARRLHRNLMKTFGSSPVEHIRVFDDQIEIVFKNPLNDIISFTWHFTGGFCEFETYSESSKLLYFDELTNLHACLKVLDFTWDSVPRRDTLMHMGISSETGRPLYATFWRGLRNPALITLAKSTEFNNIVIVENQHISSEELMNKRINRFLKTGKGFTNIKSIKTQDNFQETIKIDFINPLNGIEAVFFHSPESWINLYYANACQFEWNHDPGDRMEYSWAMVDKKHNLLKQLAQLGFTWTAFPDVNIDYDQINDYTVRVYWDSLENTVIITGKTGLEHP